MTADDSLRRLWRYKTDLEQEPDEEKLLEILQKLKRLPVSIKVLQETGIGKVINRYRKRGGVVGDLASIVVTSWRAVVEREADDSRARSPSPSHHNNSGSEKDEEGGRQSDADSWNSYKDDSNSNSSQNLDKQLKTERKRRSRDDDEAHDGKFRPVQVKVEASDSYTPSRKKRLVADETRVKREAGSNSVTTNTVTIKQEGDGNVSESYQRSLKSDSLQQHHAKHKHHKSSKGKSHEESSRRDSQDKHTHTRTKVDRTSKQHHLSSSEDEEQESEGNSDGGNTEHKPVPLSGHQSRAASTGKESSSHHHRDSSSLKKYSSSSSKHSSTSQHYSSANSHKTHKTTSSLNQQSVSPNPHEPLSVPSKDSSSSKNRESSSSGSHRKPSSSGSHRHHNHSSPGVSSRHSELKSSEPSQTRNHSPTHSAHSSHKKSLSPGSHRQNNHSSPGVSSRHSELKSSEPSQPQKHSSTHAAHNSLNENLVHIKKEKTDKDSSIQEFKGSDQKKSSSTVSLRQEAAEVKRETESAFKSSRTDLKGSSSQIAKSGSSSQKKIKHKPSFQQPDLDLFSDALHIKAEPSAADHRPKTVKKTVAAVSRPSTSAQSSSLSSRKDQPDITIKQEPVNVIEKTQAAAVEAEPSPVASQKSKYFLGEEEDEEDLFADNLNSKSDRTKSLKRKLSETSVPQDNMSFEDFMNFDETALLKKAKSTKKSSSKPPSSKSNPSETSQTTERKWSSSLSSTSMTGVTIPTPSNKVPLTEKDIMALLPETQTNYRPLWQYPDYQDEPSPAVPQVDPEMIGVKSVGRTQVYSGRKHRITEVKPLFDLCMQLLIENIDAIDCVGGIPFSILKPVFDRCSAEQLYHIEDFNPHFIEESGELWQKLAQKDFRNAKPKEDESWREVYMKQVEAREHKYQRLKQNMSSSITKGQAGRKAKLAFAGGVAKPPRDVLRRQRQFGTGQVSMTKGKNSLKGGLRQYRPSLQVPAFNPMEDRPRVKSVHPMMAKSIQMRRNMRH